MEKFVQKLRKTVRESGYKRRPLIEEFKRRMSSIIIQKLIELERSPRKIKQQYERVTNLDKYQRENKWKEKKIEE